MLLMMLKKILCVSVYFTLYLYNGMYSVNVRGKKLFDCTQVSPGVSLRLHPALF